MSNKLKFVMYDLIATFVASNKLKLCNFFKHLSLCLHFVMLEKLDYNFLHYRGERCMRIFPFVVSFFNFHGDLV
jgi:hypothetical protein